MGTLARITLDPAVMGGKACLRGLRVTVGTAAGLLAAGRSPGEILKAYPCLERQDVDEALACAAWRVEERGGSAGTPMSVNLLADMNSSPDWVPIPSDHGWPAIHWPALAGETPASDRTRRSRETGPVVSFGPRRSLGRRRVKLAAGTR